MQKQFRRTAIPLDPLDQFRWISLFQLKDESFMTVPVTRRDENVAVSA
jgi:hypothetical protein